MNAVVFVDVQKDFIDGALKNEKAIEVLPRIKEFAKKLKEADKDMVGNTTKIYATRDTHTTDYLNTLEGKKLPVEHCIEGSDGWMIDAELMDTLIGDCTFVNKTTFGSFDLARIIEEDAKTAGESLERITICGFVTDICVLSNAILLRAAFPNAEILVLSNLCAGTTQENHDAALKAMESCQIIVA